MKINDIQAIIVEKPLDHTTGANVGVRTGNQVNLCPIDGGSNFVDVRPKLRQVYIDDQPVNKISVAIGLSHTVKMKITGIQTVQLEPGATLAKKYPAEITGNTVNIQSLQTSDENFILIKHNTTIRRIW